MVIENAVEEFKRILDSWCTHCGECCTKQAVFLTDVEAPIIAQSLRELGDEALVKKHLRINSTVFNLWHRFVLHFDDDCPFHMDDRCSIYSKRPLTCQMYPVNLIGFIDRPDSSLRRACLEIVQPPESHVCSQSYDELITVGKRVFEKHPEFVDEVYQFLVSTYVDERGLGYLFGQSREGGKEAVSLSSSNPTANEIVMAILEQFRSQFEDPSEIPAEILDYSEVISDDEIVRLTSEVAARESSKETSKRIKMLKRFKPRLREYWLKRTSI
jgi:Fe-S-cluster containining protein